MVKEGHLLGPRFWVGVGMLANERRKKGGGGEEGAPCPDQSSALSQSPLTNPQLLQWNEELLWKGLVRVKGKARGRKQRSLQCQPPTHPASPCGVSQPANAQGRCLTWVPDSHLWLLPSTLSGVLDGGSADASLAVPDRTRAGRVACLGEKPQGLHLLGEGSRPTSVMLLGLRTLESSGCPPHWHAEPACAWGEEAHSHALTGQTAPLHLFQGSLPAQNTPPTHS